MAFKIPGLGAIGSLFRAIIDAALRFLGSLFQAEVQIVTNLNSIVTDFETAKANIKTEVAKLKAFKFDPKWNTRVINVPAAIKQIKDLVQSVSEGFRDKVDTLVAPIHDLARIFKAEAAPDPQGAPSAVSRAAVKVDEIATMISQLAKAMAQFKDFTQLFIKITEDVQSLEEVFLQQGNSRQAVTRKSRIRVGKLHQ